MAEEVLLPLPWTHRGEHGWMEAWNQKMELMPLTRTCCLPSLLRNTADKKIQKSLHAGDTYTN